MILSMSSDFRLYLGHFKYYLMRVWFINLFILILSGALQILVFKPPASIYVSDFPNRCPYVLSRFHSRMNGR